MFGTNVPMFVTLGFNIIIIPMWILDQCYIDTKNLEILL